VFTEGGAISFIDELHRRWTDAHPSAPAGAVSAPKPSDVLEPLPAIGQDAIFISYALEDRDAAILIRDPLKGAGLDVWFDQRSLEPGDEFREKVLSDIEQCSFFLPVISRNTAIAAHRFFFLEWNKAVDEVQFRSHDVPFIVAVVIDDLQPEAPHIPVAFRERHWQRLNQTALPDDFITLLRNRVRELRRARH